MENGIRLNTERKYNFANNNSNSKEVKNNEHTQVYGMSIHKMIYNWPIKMYTITFMINLLYA